MNRQNASMAGSRPAPRAVPPTTRNEREDAMRLVRRERRRIEHRRSGRFEYLKRVYD